MADEYKKVQVPITEEIKHLRWQFEQTEQRAERAEQRAERFKRERNEWAETWVDENIKANFIWDKLGPYKQIAATLASELEYYKELLQTIYDAFPRKINESDPCPVCWTYSHKGWCWYEQAKAALEGGEGK